MLDDDVLLIRKILSGDDTAFSTLYQINGIRSFPIKSSIARHGDLALQIKLIGY